MQENRKNFIKWTSTTIFFIIFTLSLFAPSPGAAENAKQAMPSVIVFDTYHEEETKRITKFAGYIDNDKWGKAPFDHDQHVALDSCVTCHHTNSKNLTKAMEENVPKCGDCHKESDEECTIEGTNEDKKFMGKSAVESKKAFHGDTSEAGCIGCHKQRDKEPTGCSSCHTKQDSIDYKYKQK